MKNSSHISVPVTALALPGEKDGQTTAPAMGDTVDISGTAKVIRIEGDKAYLQPETINGAAVEQSADNKSLDDEEAEMREQAKKDQAAGDGLY